MDLIASATANCIGVLKAHAGRDWHATPAADLEWSCWDTALHISDDLYFYAVQLLYGPLRLDGYLHTELTVDSGATVSHLLDAIAVHGELLRRIASTADPGDWAFHAYGVTDPAGFAAMAVVETLIHTYDIARGFDPRSRWRPPADLAAAILPRLFPDAPAGDPSAVLLYCCGRVPLGDRPRQTAWQWDARPMS